MTTVQELVDRTRNHYMNAGRREERNRLSDAIDASAESLGIDFDAGGIARGAKISLGLEDMYVWGVTGQTADVQRGQFNTTAASHASKATILVNARPTPAEVVEQFDEVIHDLNGHGLFRVRTADVTVTADDIAYDLALTDYLAPIDVRVEADGYAEDWPLIHRWDLARDLPTSDFASGNALHVYDYTPIGNTVRFRYRSRLTPGLSAMDDDVETVTGMESWMVDLLPMGAALKLMAGREIARNRPDRQGDTRRAEEVPPNAQLLSVRGLKEQFDQRLRAVQRSLLSTYPTRVRVK